MPSKRGAKSNAEVAGKHRQLLPQPVKAVPAVNTVMQPECSGCSLASLPLATDVDVVVFVGWVTSELRLPGNTSAQVDRADERRRVVRLAIRQLLGGQVQRDVPVKRLKHEQPRAWIAIRDLRRRTGGCQSRGPRKKACYAPSRRRHRASGRAAPRTPWLPCSSSTRRRT